MTYPSSKSLDHLGLVAGFCKDIQLAQYIDDALVDSNAHKVSFGQLSVAILLNGLGFTGRTLHTYSKYFESKPHDRLLGKEYPPMILITIRLGDVWMHFTTRAYPVFTKA
jgi:transposase